MQARLSLRQDREWKRIDVAPELGLDCGTYKWRQNQSLVEVFVQLPPNVEARKVRAGPCMKRPRLPAVGCGTCK